MTKQWLDFAASATGNACIFICLFEGARRVGAYGIHRTAVLLVAIGVVFCLLNSGLSYWRYDMAKDVSQTLSKNRNVDELPADWGKQLTPEQREESSLARARIVFVDSGEFRSYFDKSGEKKRYSPTEEDIKTRDLSVVTKARLEDAIHTNLADALTWLIWGIVTTSIGFGIGRYKPPLQANPSVETDARKSSARGSQ